MSNRDATFALLNRCREAGYKITLVAEEIDITVAVVRAMGRAYLSRLSGGGRQP